MKAKSALSLIVLLIFICSCKNSTDSNGSQSQNGVIMPLAAGNMWSYIDHFYDQNGSLTSSMTDTLKIVDSLIYGSDILYNTPEQTYFANKTDGLWVKYYGFSNQIFLAKYPASAGDLFRSDTFIITKESSPDPIGLAVADFIVASTAIPVSVPAGTFTCYKYNADYFDTASHQLLQRENTYYAPNVGMIKHDLFRLDSASQTLKIAQSNQLTKVILR